MNKSYFDDMQNAKEKLADLESKRRISIYNGYPYNANVSHVTSIWDEIENELKPLSIDQKDRLLKNQEYVMNQNKISEVLNNEIIRFIKPYVEANPTGRQLLEKQLAFVRSIKESVIKETHDELEIFREFQELSKTNPNITWEEFKKNKTK